MYVPTGKNPSINSSTSSHDVTGSVGERRQLVCRTTGEPPPRVTWFKKGTAGRLRNVPRKRQTERSRFVGTNGKRTKVESGYRIIHHRYIKGVIHLRFGANYVNDAQVVYLLQASITLCIFRT